LLDQVADDLGARRLDDVAVEAGGERDLRMACLIPARDRGEEQGMRLGRAQLARGPAPAGR